MSGTQPTEWVRAMGKPLPKRSVWIDHNDPFDKKGYAEINEVLCEGCGACVAACFSGAAQQKNLTDAQLLDMVQVLAS